MRALKLLVLGIFFVVNGAFACVVVPTQMKVASIEGCWADLSGRHPVISIDPQDKQIFINMSALNRPMAKGRWLDENSIEVDFLDDATFIGHLKNNRIYWDNQTVWTKHVGCTDESLVVDAQKTATVFSDNLIKNGSFEEPKLEIGTWNVFPEIVGWRTVVGSGIEIQNHVAGSPFEGDQHIELDSHSNSVIEQKVAVEPEQTYRLRFVYSPRPGVGRNSNGIRVWINQNAVLNIARSGLGLTQTQFESFEVDWVSDSNSQAAIRFEAIGMSDSLGGYLDAVEFFKH
jgi:hypothetical protein